MATLKLSTSPTPYRQYGIVSRFVLVLSAILISGYAGRLTSSAARVALAVPFVLVWIVPVIYWIGGRESM